VQQPLCRRFDSSVEEGFGATTEIERRQWHCFFQGAVLFYKRSRCMSVSVKIACIMVSVSMRSGSQAALLVHNTIHGLVTACRAPQPTDPCGGVGVSYSHWNFSTECFDFESNNPGEIEVCLSVMMPHILLLNKVHRLAAAAPPLLVIWHAFIPSAQTGRCTVRACHRVCATATRVWRVCKLAADSVG
jgi:hypothetical protein